MKFLKKIVAFFQRHPGIKTAVTGALGAAVSAAAGGTFGPKAAAVAAAVTTVGGLLVRRPQDGGPEVQNETAQDVGLEKAFADGLK
jgi:hypothetical protein